MPAASRQSLEIAPGRLPAGVMVTARSYLVDRFVPDCETLLLPGREVAGGRLDFARGPLSARPARPPGRLGALARLGAGRRRIPGRVLVDLRRNTPENWAHFLTNHLPIVFRMAEAAEIPWEDLLLLLPARTPAHIRAAAGLFGLAVEATDARVAGEGLDWDARPWTGIRPARADWVRTPRVRAALAPVLAGAAALPARVLLARRGGRALANEAEIRAALAGEGFETVCPEDLSPADQIRLLARAEEVVAIHGAGLAPLLYRPAEAGPLALVELFPCGHVTDVFRQMAHQVGAAWIGVRGRIRPEHVRPAYDLGRPFLGFSLQDFTVDPVALDRARRLLHEGHAARIAASAPGTRSAEAGSGDGSPSA